VCTEPGGLYDIDPDTGHATNCGGRNFHWHQSYRVDLKASEAKCCTPNVNCGDCRLNAVALASLVFRLDRFLGSLDEFRDWLDICEQYGRSNLLDSDPVWSVAANPPQRAESGRPSSDLITLHTVNLPCRPH
jgi:hypothetical protein